MTRILDRYRDFLPITPATPRITIGEGDTPLVRSRKLEIELGCGELYFKLEGCNPTGSFKDRGMVIAVAKALEAGSKAIACASTGNTSASAAAYGAHCGLKVFVLVPRQNTALGKLAQALVFGARVISIDGNFDQSLQMVRTLTQRHPITLVNSVNPHRIEGQKTAAFEIADALGQAPDYLFLPVGNAGNITAYWRGFVQYREAGRTGNLPRMMGFEAEGAAAIVHNKVIEKPQTIATAIRIGNPASWQGALAARDESGGVIDCVSDNEILKAYRLLAAKEGIFGEPASAASLAGLIKSVQNGLSFMNKKVVCVITGNGLKDTDTALKQASPLTEVTADLAAVEQAVISEW
ncbi:MAG: threonine synthase [Dehalococcoidia bacterium]|nr:Threonine synthase [Chloroflexota bacterium]MBT9159356.1 Threonine synthase [Chloroflexota bacterium]MBT9162114.1 Threonine synthase [Chloroflexota bacterium]